MCAEGTLDTGNGGQAGPDLEERGLMGQNIGIGWGKGTKDTGKQSQASWSLEVAGSVCFGSSLG